VLTFSHVLTVCKRTEAELTSSSARARQGLVHLLLIFSFCSLQYNKA